MLNKHIICLCNRFQSILVFHFGIWCVTHFVLCILSYWICKSWSWIIFYFVTLSAVMQNVCIALYTISRRTMKISQTIIKVRYDWLKQTGIVCSLRHESSTLANYVIRNLFKCSMHRFVCAITSESEWR